MAGARVGMAFADPEIISLMDKVKYPYNLSTLAQEAVRKKIEEAIVPVGASRRAPVNRVDEVEKVEKVEKVLQQTAVVQIVAERERLADALKTVPCVEKVFPSDANFLLIKVTNAKSIYNYLVGQGIVVRDRSSQPLCENCLRITVGTPEENDAVVKALGDYKDNQTKRL